ncbi:MAG: TonB-dependent receptor, partial [Acidobacteria bacterium]|nr:TonB-dependent receptor [Acidobacteriota bacterium]
LVPGNYGVRAELAGFKAAVRESIAVNADVTVRIDLRLEVGELTDAVTVTGEAPLLDTTTALNQAILDRATLDRLPTGHDMWSIGKTVPGLNVTNYDVGGNQSFQQYTMSAHGSSGSENKWAIDGLDVAWAGGAGTVMVYFDPNMFEEINYQVGNISAENRQGGVVMNMVTKTGTNDFHGSFMFTGTRDSMQSNNLQSGSELYQQLARRIPAIVLAANPNIRPGQQILSLFDTSATLSGPVVKDRFWFTMTYKISSLNQYLLGVYNPNGTQGVDDNRIDNKTFKLSYKLTEASQMHYTYSRNLKDRYHRRTATYQEDRAARHQDQWADIHQLKWTGTLSSRMVADAGVSLQHGPSPYLPKAEAIRLAGLGLFPETDTSTGASTVMNSGYNTQPQYRAASNFNVSYFAGPHDLKIGYQFGRLMLRSKTWSLVDPSKGAPLPGPFLARFNRGAPNSVILYNYPVDTRVFLQEHGFFIQDKWAVNRKLTLNLGLRFDAVRAWVPEQCQPETAFVTGQCFAEIKDPQIPKLLDMAPRLSLIYDMFGDGRTAIKASANLYHDGLASGYASVLNPYGAASNTVAWTDRNGDRKPQPNEIAFDLATKRTSSGTGFSFGNNNFYDPDLKRPFSVELSLGVQQELPGGFALGATYFRRDSWRNIDGQNIALNASHYDPVNIALPENNQRLTIYNIKREFQTLQSCTGVGPCLYRTNRSDRGGYFNGLDITLNKRMSNRWMVMSGLSLNSDQTRTVFRPDNPNLNLFVGGPAGDNIPVMFKAAVVYQAPLGFEFAGNFQHFAGTPEQKTYQITRTLVPQLTATSMTVNIGERGETSKPDVRLLDIS